MEVTMKTHAACLPFDKTGKSNSTFAEEEKQKTGVLASRENSFVDSLGSKKVRPRRSAA